MKKKKISDEKIRSCFLITKGQMDWIKKTADKTGLSKACIIRDAINTLKTQRKY
jgi:hypothetical protein